MGLAPLTLASAVADARPSYDPAMPITRRSLLTSAAATVLAGSARAGSAAPARPQVLNDASRLDVVPVAAHAIVRAGDDERLIAELRTLLKEAAENGHPVCVGGARHSMGGQSLPRAGSRSRWPPRTASLIPRRARTGCVAARAGIR